MCWDCPTSTTQTINMTESDADAEAEQVTPAAEETDIPASSDEDLVSASPWRTYYNAATDFGANGSDKKPDEISLKKALYEAGLAGQSLQQMIEVFVPRGTYHLTDTLFIFSNTWLHLAEGAILYRDDPSKVMLLGVYLDPNGNIVHSEKCNVRGYNQVREMIQSGEFSKEDSVVILHGDARLETVLLDVIPCGGAVDFNTELKANMHKKTAGVNTTAWLILDVEQGVAHGDVIAKA